MAINPIFLHLSPKIIRYIFLLIFMLPTSILLFIVQINFAMQHKSKKIDNVLYVSSLIKDDTIMIKG